MVPTECAAGSYSGAVLNSTFPTLPSPGPALHLPRSFAVTGSQGVSERDRIPAAERIAPQRRGAMSDH